MMHPLWRSALRFGALATASLALIGCLAPEPPPPPFRIAPYGPGLDIARNGALVTLQEHGETIGRVRVAAHSLRVQTAEATPIGRVRIAGDGWTFVRRDGSSRCYAPDHAHGDDAIALCDDVGAWTAAPTATSVTVRTPTGAITRLPLREDLAPIRSGGREWTPAARALLQHAFEQTDDDSDDVAALILLSWLLKDHASTEDEGPAPVLGPDPAEDAPAPLVPLEADPARTSTDDAPHGAQKDDDATPP